MDLFGSEWMCPGYDELICLDLNGCDEWICFAVIHNNIVNLVTFLYFLQTNDVISQSYKIVDNLKMKQGIKNFERHTLSFNSGIHLHQ